MFVLDTNVISELRKAPAGRADSHVVTWAASCPADALFLCTVTVMELQMGILRLERRDPAQAALLHRWLHHAVLPAFQARILGLDLAVALRCATP